MLTKIAGLLPDDTETWRHAGLYTPKDFAQESEDLPFLYDMRTNESLVALGPHLALVFPDAGADPMHTRPRRMPRPTRPRLRLDRGIEQQHQQSAVAASQGRWPRKGW